MMNTYYLVIFVILGLIFGSFFNVLGLRLCKNENILFPTSHCPNCKHKLKFYELIPVLSYIFLRGRCHYCKSKISIMYPVIELLTAILFGLCFYIYGFSIELALGLLLSSLLMIVIVTDINYYIIPDSIIIVFGVLIFIYNIITKGAIEACTHVAYGVIVFAFMYALMKFGNALFKEESLGGGDIKLMSILGMLNNPIVTIVSLALSSAIALPCSLLILIIKKDKIIPFGPFLIIGIIIITLLKVDTTTIINFLIK